MEGFTGRVEVARTDGWSTFRAVDVTTGQPVTLDVVDGHGRHHLDARDAYGRARALAGLSAHPDLVTVHRLVRGRRGTLVVVTEPQRGSLAGQLLATGPLPVREAVATVVRVAGALETLHRAGVVHGRVTPAALVRTASDRPVLTATGPATAPGTPASSAELHHSAPEVLLGAVATTASDVYGLASTLHELLVGHPPYLVTEDEDPIDLRRRIISGPPPRLEAPGVDARLRDLARRGLATDPVDRPASAAAVAEELVALERSRGWPESRYRVDGPAHGTPRDRRTPDRVGPTSAAPTTSPAMPTSIARDATAAVRGLQERASVPAPDLGASAGAFDTVAPRDRGLTPAPAAGHPMLPGRDAPLLGPEDAAPPAVPTGDRSTGSSLRARDGEPAHGEVIDGEPGDEVPHPELTHDEVADGEVADGEPAGGDVAGGEGGDRGAGSVDTGYRWWVDDAPWRASRRGGRR